MLKESLPFWDERESHISHLSKVWLHLFCQNCEKFDFLYPCMLTSTIMISEMGVNSLSSGSLGQQKCDSIIDLIFIP